MRGAQARLGCLLLLPLLLHASMPAGTAAAPPTAPQTYPVLLPAGYYEYFPLDAYANATVVQYSTVSNVSISTAFMTSAQLRDFNQSSGLISNSIAHGTGTKIEDTVRVGPGTYDILVYANDRGANATLSVSAYPNNPFVFGRSVPPESSGIVSYGLTNQSGTDNPYLVASTDVVGLASIRSMGALNSSAGSVGVNPTGLTLQLNSMLVVDEGSVGSQVYWCQNTPDFVTSASQVSLTDNVWNASADGALTNGTINSQGGGSVRVLRQNGTSQDYYAVERSNSTYSLPLGLVLLINATAEPGTGVLVQFGARTTGGVLGTPGAEWFDNVTIHDPAARSAYFATDGNYSAPNGQFYDTELVFGGEANGEATYFTNMTASLGLYHANGTGPWLDVFPSYFSFGLDTKEAADNLRMSYLGNGQASVTTGSPDYVYLGSASGAVTADAAEAALGFPEFATSTTTTPSTATTAARSSTSTQSNGISEFPSQALAVTALVAITTASYMVARRRRSRPSTGLG